MPQSKTHQSSTNTGVHYVHQHQNVDQPGLSVHKKAPDYITDTHPLVYIGAYLFSMTVAISATNHVLCLVSASGSVHTYTIHVKI